MLSHNLLPSESFTLQFKFGVKNCIIIIKQKGGGIIKVTINSTILKFVLVIIICCLVSSPVASNSLQEFNQTLADNIEKITPAVVKIKALTNQEEETGAGFIVSDQGHIVTSHHLIKDAKEIKIRLKDNKDYLTGTVKGVDPAFDLAVLELENFSTPLPQVELGNSASLRPGHLTVAIGHPYNFDYSLSWGIVSSTEQELTIDSNTRGTNQIYSGLIQTDASINPGNSGGPLVNINGKVVGIITGVNTEGVGISFAIPINKAKASIQQIKEHGKPIKPWLGIFLQNLNQTHREHLNLEQDFGLLVSTVVPGSPAAKAGLQSGDIILKFNGEKISNSQQYITKLNELEIGTEMEITMVANLISLTPGTLSLDVSDDRKVLYIHAMFLDDEEGLRRNLKEMEHRALELFR